MHKNSAYIESIRHEYALMVLTERAIPSFADGLKTSARRIMWMARNGHKFKSAALAGATMAIHPHSTPEGAVNTLAAFYSNNHHLLHGYGDFGTMLAPDTYGASRYTSVQISEFAKDVFFNDEEIIPLKPNYDYTQQEPVHFLPIIPVSLVNPSEGIAIGFASNILSRDLKDIINAQILHLSGRSFKALIPTYDPYGIKAETPPADNKWYFKGAIERVNSTTIRIVKVPPKTHHYHLVGTDDPKKPGILNKLLESQSIVDYTDNSKKTIDISVKFKRGILETMSDDDILNMFKLITAQTENLNVIHPDTKNIMKFDDVTLIQQFTDWRLAWYIKRYERLKMLLDAQIRRYLDVLIAIKHDAGGVSRTKANRSEYKSWLESVGVKDSEYVSSLPSYRYTIEEKSKIEQSLREAIDQKAEYEKILASEDERKKIYIQELAVVRKKYCK